MQLEGWMILDGRPVGQSNCSASSRHPRSNVPSLRPHPVEFIFSTTAHSGVRRNGEEEEEERSLDRFVARCESCKVPTKQPAACKVRQNANSVMCWRAMNPKRATLAVDLGGRSSTAKLA